MRLFFRLLLLISVFILSSCSSDQGTYHVSITAVPTEAGIVTPDEGDFTVDRTLEISAIPNEHWVFERWEGDHTGAQNPVIINLDSDKDIAAIFTKRDYPLIIHVEGEGSVSEQVVQSKSTDYPHGTIVEVTAQPETGWEFVEWQGDLESAENPATITIDDETEITAVFARIEYPLTINIVGEGSVTEDVVQAKVTDYPHGAVVELTAVPDSNWAFIQWEGDIESIDNPVEITIDEPKTITVTFERIFMLTTISVPAGGGRIEPADGEFIRDTSFDVEAIPNDGWRFVEWRGDFTGTTNPFNLTMNGNKTLEAHFEPLSFSLSTNVEGKGSILTSVLRGGETADGYEFNSEVELTAAPADGWKFMRWEGDVTGTVNPTTIIVNESKSVTAIFSVFDGGEGTPADPYEVSTVGQLQSIADYADSYFILMQNIDASATAGWNTGDGFNPIGDDTTPFSGGFNGNGFAISNLTINRPLEQFVGFFGYTDGALIQNITLSNASISGNDTVGILAGLNSGDIINASSAGSVNGTSIAGGLIGENDGSVQESSTLATVNGSANVGGLIGRNNSTVTDSYATGVVTGIDMYTGGLIGTNSGLVERSYASGNVNGSFVAGGLVGQNSGSGQIGSSYASGDVSGNENIGGFVGSNSDGAPGIAKSYSLGSVTGTNFVGGFTGSNADSGVISEVYTSGVVSGFSNVGGFAGGNTSTIEISYWDSDLSTQASGVGTGSSTGVTGLTTAQMTGSEAQTNMADFDWVDAWVTVAGSYPILQWQSE